MRVASFEPRSFVASTRIRCGVGMAAGLALLAGCSPVAAYQRGHLAHPGMDPGLEAAESSFHAHVEAAREGGAGGHHAAGGGCGCG